MLTQEHLARLFESRKSLQERRGRMLGFPLNLCPLPLTYLNSFLDLVINNLGDPFDGALCGMNTFEYEREVVRWFADLWGLKDDMAWGYVTNCGSEGNFQGLALGRERLGDPVLYASAATHYSVWKAARWLRLEVHKIKVDSRHRLDIADLGRNLVPGRPALLCLNIGTTMAGAVDNINDTLRQLREAGVAHYIHLDAALAGLILPFLPHRVSGVDGRFFRHPIDSVSVSGHKMPGCPIPCGAFVSRSVVADTVEYVGSRDATVGGSRDGWSVLALWMAIHHHGRDGFAALAKRCLEMAEEAGRQLSKIGWPHWRAPDSICVMLQRPSERICRDWQLATEGEFAHIVAMPHVTETMIERFVSELREDDSWAAIACSSEPPPS